MRISGTCHKGIQINNGSNQAFDLNRIKAMHLRNTSFSSHLLLTVYRKLLLLLTLLDPLGLIKEFRHEGYIGPDQGTGPAAS